MVSFRINFIGTQKLTLNVCASIEGFIGNPEVQVYNPPISNSGTDGGFSDPIYFSDPVKLNVTIAANSLTKTFSDLREQFEKEL